MSRGKIWTASVLKRRGWSNALMRELLPKPNYRMSGGHPVRFWVRAEVEQAEQNPTFLSRGKGLP